MQFSIMKLSNGLFAADGEESQEAAARIKTGAILRGEFTKMRHPEFHRKFFALMQLGFDIWTETAPTLEYRGQEVRPTINNFRKDVTILAGWYHSYVSLKGEVRLEAKSISFASMDQIEFEALFSQCINVLLTKVLTTKMDEEQLRARVDDVLRFDK